MTDHDPTAIDILFDPMQQRMRGIAYHGDTPFDVPFVSEIAENLWQGGCEGGLILPSFIDYVVSLYKWEAYTVVHATKGELTVRMYDSDEEPVDREQVLTIARQVNEWRKDGTVLVHCQAGLNRSSLIAGLALVLEGMTPHEAVQLLREKRSPAVLCNPLFERWLLDFVE